MSHTPGESQTRSKQWGVFGGYPLPSRVEVAVGCRVLGPPHRSWYTDWTASLATIGLGYEHPAVTGAVLQAIHEGGPSFPLPHALEETYAEALCGALRWPDQARFVKTGSEATAAALLIARRVTGRRRVVSVGYHGWHEAHLPCADLLQIPWGDTRTLLNSINGETAAVLIEPMRIEVPSEGYLRAARAECHRWGALFIMDEIVTGFRWAIGGATEYFALDPPDLACYGKAMANGYPLAAVVGKRYLMKHAVDVSSTFGGDTIALAAAQAVLQVYQQEKVVDHLWQIGGTLIKGCPNILQGYSVHPVFKASTDWDLSDEAIPHVRRAAGAGHLVHPAGLYPMFSHTESDAQSLAHALCG